MYVTQPVLPVLAVEFGVDSAAASLTVSAVVLGIALSTLPFGELADRFPIRPIIVAGGAVVFLAGLLGSLTGSLSILIGARFVQGLFIPAVSACLAAYLGKTLPANRLNVVMGAYVAATGVGGLGGRLLGGWIHEVLNWRYGVLAASVVLLTVTLVAARWLPAAPRRGRDQGRGPSYLGLLSRWGVIRVLVVSFTSFFVFSSVFNYLPFFMAAPPINASNAVITSLYLSYIIGFVIGPLSGRLSNRLGNGVTIALGALIFAASVLLTLVAQLWAVAISLVGACGGFFAMHAAAVGLVNRRSEGSQGRANSLYVLSYYLGGSAGITLSGFVYQWGGWTAVVVFAVAVLVVPCLVGLGEVFLARPKDPGRPDH
ncbi:MAG: MFS transporter [Proteobacteria bacterium]|nr:MFS transporter [Pseudomonadota bacterium]MBU1743075.1 MFS transporter [Pseudomonadota bacterium]